MFNEGEVMCKHEYRHLPERAFVRCDMSSKTEVAYDVFYCVHCLETIDVEVK